MLGLAGLLAWGGGLVSPEAKATMFSRSLRPDDSADKLPKLDGFRVAIAGADRLEVEDLSYAFGRRFRSFVCRDAKAVRTLADSLELVPSPTTVTDSCVCDGHHRFRFYSGEKLLAEIGLRNRGYLRPEKSDWLGDGELTKDSVRAIHDWFSEQGFPLDIREYSAELSRKVFKEAFSPEFLAAAKALRSGDADPEHFHETSFAGIPGGEKSVEFGKLICRSLYRALDTEGWGAEESSNCEWLLGRFSNAQWDSLIRACEGDAAALCGAWSVFAAEFDRLDETKRSGWLLKIAEAKFRASRSGEVAPLFYRLWLEDSPESKALLRRVARGEMKTGMVQLDFYPEPPVRADVFACLPLSWSKDDADTLAVIAALEKRHASGPEALSKTERLLLDIARENSSDEKLITTEHLKLEPYLANYAWRVLARRGTPEAIDLLIPFLAERSGDSSWSDSDRAEIATTLATMTGRRMPPERRTGETDTQFRERFDAWTDDLAKWWALGRAPAPAEQAK